MDGVSKGLLDSVRAAPDDDAPRWVVADWFESAGQTDRARLLRIQLEAARLPAWDVGRAVRAVEERVLLARNGGWAAALPAIDGVTWGRFDRGFVGRAAFSSPRVLADHGAACADATVLSSVALRWPRVTDRVELPRLEGVTELVVAGTLMDPEDVAWLVSCPLLATVRRLTLVGSQLELPALEHLLASPIAAQLEVLRLPLHNFGNDGLLRLVQADLQNLVELDVSVASLDDLGSGGRWLPTIGAEAVAALARWPGLARLRSLDLTGNQIGAEGLAALLTSPHAANLKSLRLRSIADWDFEDGDGRPDVLVGMADAAPGLQLDEIDLSECDVTEDSSPAVYGSPALQQVKILRYTYGQALSALMQAPWVGSLRIVEAVDVGDSGMSAVLGADLPHLHTLRLGSTHAWSHPGSVSELFAEAKPLPALVMLDLSELDVGDEDLAALGASEALPALVALDVTPSDPQEPALTEEGVQAFVASPLGARLRSLTTGHEALDVAPAPARVAVYDAYDYQGTHRYL